MSVYTKKKKQKTTSPSSATHGYPLCVQFIGTTKAKTSRGDREKRKGRNEGRNRGWWWWWGRGKTVPCVLGSFPPPPLLSPSLPPYTFTLHPRPPSLAHSLFFLHTHNSPPAPLPSSKHRRETKNPRSWRTRLSFAVSLHFPPPTLRSFPSQQAHSPALFLSTRNHQQLTRPHPASPTRTLSMFDKKKRMMQKEKRCDNKKAKRSKYMYFILKHKSHQPKRNI